ncbi:MAG TPA: alkaline phosphatase family protein [Hymenobacter sp.]
MTAETESGNISAPAETISDTEASNQAGVKFSQPSTTAVANATTPCIGAAPPAAWNHVVVLMFENTFNNEITSGAAPWIHGMQQKCGSYATWKDADSTVTGAVETDYPSKPQYATLTSGVSPSVHGLKTNAYTTTSSVDNIFNRLRQDKRTTKVYVAGTGSNCQASNFNGAYHDPLRYFTNLGGQSSTNSTFCNTNDVPITDFTTDVNSGNLPEFSMIIPTNAQNMHDNTVSSGDSWARDFLVPLLDSEQYKSGDTAVFFLWDEYTSVPNVLISPSIKPGTNPVTPAGNPISHFSATRTWQEMLGITPLLGVSGQAPSLLDYYEGT